MPRNYFVTGASGAIGSELVKLLLCETENKIWLLLRAESETHLFERFDSLLDYYELDEVTLQDARARIIPVKGDMDLPEFSINSEQYSEIVRECSHIIHCAGVVRMNLPIQVARKHAVDSAKNIVDLALACQSNGNLEKIDIVSTVGVAGRMDKSLPEAWIVEKRQFHNTYEESKAEAEDFLKDQIAQHQLPVTIHRPSMVVGDSKTGKIIHFQIFYFLSEFLSGRRTFGIFPYLGSATLDTVPVDYVAKVIKWSSEQPSTIDKIFHLSSGLETAIKLVELQELVRRALQKNRIKVPGLITLPVGLFKFIIALVTPFLDKKTQRAIKTLPVFLDYLSGQQVFGNEQTVNFINELGGPELPVIEEYFEVVWLHYMQQHYSNK